MRSVLWSDLVPNSKRRWTGQRSRCPRPQQVEICTVAALSGGECVTHTKTGAPPPVWVVRGARLLIDGCVAVVTHVGSPWTGDRGHGPVYVRPERGGCEFTVGGPFVPAGGDPIDERLSKGPSPGGLP